MSQEPVSLETPIGEDGVSELRDLIEDKSAPFTEDVVTHNSMREQLDQALGCLKTSERQVIELRFGLIDGQSRTLEEIGGVLNLTRERIRQIERNALTKLRSDACKRGLHEFLI